MIFAKLFIAVIGWAVLIAIISSEEARDAVHKRYVNARLWLALMAFALYIKLKNLFKNENSN